MLNKKLIIIIVVIAAFIGFILITKTIVSKARPKRGVSALQARKDSGKAPKKLIISKGKGGLTVRILNLKNMEIPMRIKAFKAAGSDSSAYCASSVGGRMQELAPGTYDIEVDTVPQKIFKNIKVSEGRETVKDLGCVTGSLFIKTTNARKAAAYYPMRILYPRTNDMVTAFMTNKAIEVIPGVYDIEIGTSPRQYKKNVRIDAGKEVIIDMGCLTGSLLVKVEDENKKSVRSGVRVTMADTNEIVNSTTSNKPIELGKGTYNIEILSNPKQSKRGVKVETGEESVVEFLVKAPAIPQKGAAAPLRPAAPARVKR